MQDKKPLSPKELKALKEEVIREMWGLSCLTSHIAACVDYPTSKLLRVASSLGLKQRKEPKLDPTLSIPR